MADHREDPAALADHHADPAAADGQDTGALALGAAGLAAGLLGLAAGGSAWLRMRRDRRDHGR